MLKGNSADIKLLNKKSPFLVNRMRLLLWIYQIVEILWTVAMFPLCVTYIQTYLIPMRIVLQINSTGLYVTCTIGSQVNVLHNQHSPFPDLIIIPSILFCYPVI